MSMSEALARVTLFEVAEEKFNRHDRGILIGMGLSCDSPEKPHPDQNSAIMTIELLLCHFEERDPGQSFAHAHPRKVASRATSVPVLNALVTRENVPRATVIGNKTGYQYRIHPVAIF